MKHEYIDTLLSEIQQLESKVANLKENQKVPFSFFRDSFKQTQEITRLLHELEFVQIEDMKGQMLKLVQFLSESESSKEESKDASTVKDADLDADTIRVSTFKDHPLAITSNATTNETKSKETVEKKSSLLDQIRNESTSLTSDREAVTPILEPVNFLHPVINEKEKIVDHLSANNKSLNDVQQANHTILDTKRSISLNDRFLFQRELFDNSREAMNDMLTKLQSFSTFDATESYLKENTDWNFKDETVDKFMQMLKESFR